MTIQTQNASEAARKLGSIKSERKAQTSRENGKKGGRPRHERKELIYAPTMYLFRDGYQSKREYMEAYQDCCRHYGYKARIEGGWIFFEHPEDYETWKNQK